MDAHQSKGVYKRDFQRKNENAELATKKRVSWTYGKEACKLVTGGDHDEGGGEDDDEDNDDDENLARAKL